LSRTNSTYQASPQNFFPFSYGKTIGESAPDDFLYVKENHLGSVLATVSDRKLPVESTSTPGTVAYYLADVTSATDMYSGGMQMPGRSFNSNSYRYGHNTQEKDDEIFNGAYTAEFWEYDARTLRRWNTDPVVKAWESPYATFNGNPILIGDPKGLDGEKKTRAEKRQEKVTSQFNEKIVKPITDAENKGDTPDQIRTLIGQLESDNQKLLLKVQGNTQLPDGTIVQGGAPGGTSVQGKKAGSGGLKALISYVPARDILVPEITPDNPLILPNQIFNTGAFAPPGSSVSIDFNALSITNVLDVSILNPPKQDYRLPNEGATSLFNATVTNQAGGSYTSAILTRETSGAIFVKVGFTRATADNFSLKITVHAPRQFGVKYIPYNSVINKIQYAGGRF